MFNNLVPYKDKRAMIYNFLKDILTVFSEDCYFKVHWKIYCPGCGGTRALLELVQGNFIQSIKYNPIVIFFLIDIILMSILGIVERKNGKYFTASFRKIINIIFLAFIVVFSLMRNYFLYGYGIDVLGDFS